MQELRQPQEPFVVCLLTELRERRLRKAVVSDLDLVVILERGRVYVLEGRCPHRHGHMADGCVEGGLLVCASHGWDFDLTSGRSISIPGQRLGAFQVWIDEQKDTVSVDLVELRAWQKENPDPFRSGECLGV